MITQDRNGNALPATADIGRLQWSARIAYTAGDYLTPANWTYYELPASAILSRSRQSVLDGSTWQCSLTILADAVPELSDVQAYYQLEIDLVDDAGNAWPYHTGPIDSIADAYDEMNGAIVQTKEISSYGTLQRLKNARCNGVFWDGNAQSPPAYQVLTGFAEAVNFTLATGGVIGGYIIDGAWHTVDATVTGGLYPGIIVSPNADFSAPYASPANYTVTATDGAQLQITFVTAPAATVYVKYWAVRYWGLRRADITFAGYGGDPTFVRIPDGRMPAGSTQTAPRRRIQDSNFTLAAAGCTTTVIAVQDPQPYQNVYSTALVAPAGTYEEILCHTAADGTETFRRISSTNASGVITLTAALPSAPVEGDPIRIVTTEIERELLPDTAGNVATFWQDALGLAEHPRDAFGFDARQGILLPFRPTHWTSASEGVYAYGLRYVPSTKGTLGSTDASLESFVYRTFTDFPATDVTKFFRTADFVQGAWSGCYVKSYSKANTTWDAVLREVTGLAAAPNVFVHDLPDGRIKVGAYSQAITPDATLQLLQGIDIDAQPEPITGVLVKSIAAQPFNITGQCRLRAAEANANSAWLNPVRMFDGRKDIYAELDDPLGAFNGSELGLIVMTLPPLPLEAFPYLDRLVVYPGPTQGVFSVGVLKTTAAGVSTTRFVQGMGYVVQSADAPSEIPGALIEEAIFALGFDASARYAVYIEARSNYDGTNTELFTATEIELYADVQAIWLARMNDQTIGAPSGYTTANQQGFGSIWWQSDRTKPVSERYVPSTYLRRVIPGYDSAGTYRFDRLQVIEMEQTTAVEVRRYAETFMDEYMRLGRTYRTQAILDPRIDLGDTVCIALDDGTTLDLFVWSIADSGSADDLTASYTLIDYSA